MRPLPPVTSFDDLGGTQRVAAVILRDVDSLMDKRYPVGIRIGTLTNYSQLAQLPLNLNVGNTNFFNYQPGSAVEIDPTHFLFTRNSSSATKTATPLFPIVVYRQQVANSALSRAFPVTCFR